MSDFRSSPPSAAGASASAVRSLSGAPAPPTSPPPSAGAASDAEAPVWQTPAKRSASCIICSPFA
eukprot:4856264-Alexandrium_andersonii.AAC.1